MLSHKATNVHGAATSLDVCSVSCHEMALQASSCTVASSMWESAEAYSGCYPGMIAIALLGAEGYPGA